MSIRTIRRRCIFCGKEYPFNPTAGKYGCPRCERKSNGFMIGPKGWEPEVIIDSRNKMHPQKPFWGGLVFKRGLK